MGDPKFSRKKYDTPSHPWQGARIKEEGDLVRKYGLKNKTEVWKARSLLRSVRGQARDLQGKQRLNSPQVESERKALLARIHRLGMIDETATLDDLLSLNVEAVLVRRLQTQAYLKGLAATTKQARQLIVHGHVMVDGGRVTVPGMIVTRAQEQAIQYAPNSPLVNEQHPVRPKLTEGQAPTLTLESYTPKDARFGGRGRGGPGGRGRGGGSKPRGGRGRGPAGPSGGGA
ncbi:MAG: 30S ribosomal protein S4 [Thermoplasmatota archaeon]